MVVRFFDGPSACRSVRFSPNGRSQAMWEGEGDIDTVLVERGEEEKADLLLQGHGCMHSRAEKQELV